MKTFFHNRRMLLAAAAAATLAPRSHAQDWPAKPIRWVVGFPPGGGTDVLARTVSAQLSTQLKQQIVVDNRTGAAGMVAAEQVARAPADGYTILTADITILALNPAIYSSVRYHPVDSFDPIGLMARFPLLVVTHPGSGIRSMKHLVEEVGKRGEFNYGSAGIGTPHHMVMELVASTTGIAARHIPYRGDTPSLQDVAAGQVAVGVIAPNAAIPFVKDGKLVPLAVTGDRRLAQLPDVPTLKELGYVSNGVHAWQGLVAPKGTPAAVIELISKEMQAAVNTPVVTQRLADLSMEPIPGDAASMAVHVRSEIALWAQLAKARGIKAESS